MKTKIFKNYEEFLEREDKDINGVSPEFAEINPKYEKENETNKACWNCIRCRDCSGCSDCIRCSGCSNIAHLKDKKNLSPEPLKEQAVKPGFPEVPVIKNIHQKVFEAALKPQALDMRNWHTCKTMHCRAGWVVTLAGEEGRNLEKKTSTLFAAMQIYKASSPIRVSPPRFFDTNEKALEDMKKCAEKENK